MALEDLTGTNKFIANLVASNPTPTDGVVQGDDHIRGIKQVLLNSFPFINGINKIGLPGQPIAVTLANPTCAAVASVSPAVSNFNTAPITYTPKVAGSVFYVIVLGSAVLISTNAGLNRCDMNIANVAGGGAIGPAITLGFSPLAAGGNIQAPLVMVGIVAAPSVAPMSFNLTGSLSAAGSATIIPWVLFLECSP